MAITLGEILKRLEEDKELQEMPEKDYEHLLAEKNYLEGQVLGYRFKESVMLCEKKKKKNPLKPRSNGVSKFWKEEWDLDNRIFMNFTVRLILVTLLCTTWFRDPIEVMIILPIAFITQFMENRRLQREFKRKYG